MATPKTDFPPVKACLFDMDGLLIDSEDIYTLVTNTVLLSHNRAPLPWSIKAQLQGRPGSAAHDIFHAWAQLPMTRAEYIAQTSALQREHFPSTKPLPGVQKLLETLKEAGVQMALATSSNKVNFGLKTAHLAPLFAHFPPSQQVTGDDTRIASDRGKPAPDIYLLALETVNANLRQKREREILPKECLVFEDSVPGIEAGRRAGMRVLWCPHPGLLEEFKGKEEEVLAGLCGDGNGTAGDTKVEGWPANVGDGWGERLGTLEEFDYGRYGIEVRRVGGVGEAVK
ncbi:hypothetical protein MMC30_002670 [Trapelia coarctata]|nr:hypothetical protein [Trapelia coarctata]